MKKLEKSFCLLALSLSLTILLLFLTPAGGWADDCPYHNYYEGGFVFLGVTTLCLTMWCAWIDLNNVAKNSPNY